MNFKSRRAGFTLVELLVVMAVMAIFIGVMGIALTRGDRSHAVESGQRTLSSLMTAARSQAILKQSKTRLIVHFDPPATVGDTEKRRAFLRFSGILVKRGDDKWEALNDGSYLPRGVCFVPPWDYEVPPGEGAGPDTALLNEVIPMVDSDNYWERRTRSVVDYEIMRYAYGHRYDLGPPDPNDEEYYFYIEFNSRGRIVGGTTTELFGQQWERRLVIAPAQEDARLPRFEEKGHQVARGGMILQNGAFIPVNFTGSFPEP